LIDSNRYLKELIRYIHLNPIRAKLVDDPLDYYWSSHQAYLMEQEFAWLERDEGLKYFGEFRQEAMEHFHHFVISGISQSDGIDFKKGVSQGIVGDEVFINRIQEEADNTENNGALPIDLNTLISFLTDWYDVDAALLQSPGIERKGAHIRAVAAFLAGDANGLSLRELADFFGRADNTMSQAAARLEVRMRTSDPLKIEVESLKTNLLLFCRDNQT